MSILGLLFLALGACRKGNIVEPKEPDPSPEFFVASFDPDQLQTSNLFNPAQLVGEVDYLNEASGLIQSHYNQNLIWTHNDGGNSSELFLMDARDASLKQKYHLLNSSNLDWEDISVYYSNGFSYMYIGDVGDNFGFRNNYSLYAFEEPFYDSSNAQPSITTRKIDFVYPSGKKNCEAIMVDPLSGDLIFATKAFDKTEIYIANAFQLNSAVGEIELKKIGELPLKNVTAGDISQDGSFISLRTYDDLILWVRDTSETLEEAFLKTPQKLPYNGMEPQGEAFCWVNNGYYTLGEKISGLLPRLFYYSKK